MCSKSTRTILLGVLSILLSIPTLAADSRRGPASPSQPTPTTSEPSVRNLRMYDQCLMSGENAEYCQCVVSGQGTEAECKMASTPAVEPGNAMDILTACLSNGGNQDQCECLARGGSEVQCGTVRGKPCIDENGNAGAKDDSGRCILNNTPPTACNYGTEDDGVTCKNSPSEATDLCPGAQAAVATACNSESQSWMGQINNITRAVGPTAAQVNPSICGGIAAASSGAQASVAAFAVMCQNATKDCVSACVNNPTAIADCRAKGNKAEEAQRQVASAMLTLQGSVAACKNAFGSLNNQAQTYCATNPAACQVPNLGGIQGNALAPDQASGLPTPGLDTAGVGGKTGNGSNFNLSDLGDEPDEAVVEAKPSEPGEKVGGPKGGGHVADGGGTIGGDAGNGRSGKGGSSTIGNILSGFFGSGGGFGSGGFRKFLGGGKGSSTSSSGESKRNGIPDLRQFLPGGMHDPTKNRGIAGQFIGRDGMTGPHSDIWKNINNRYQYKRASLLP